MNYNQEIKEKKENVERIIAKLSEDEIKIIENSDYDLVLEALQDKIEACDNELKNEGNIIDEK